MTGYFTEIDVAGGVQEVQQLRAEVNPLGIHVKVIKMDGPAGGNPLVRLRTTSRRKVLETWLAANGYDSTVTDGRSGPNSVPHTKQRT